MKCLWFLLCSVAILLFAPHCSGSQVDFDLSGSILSINVKEQSQSCSLETGSIARVDLSKELEALHFLDFTVDASKFEDGLYEVSCEVSCVQNLNPGRPNSAGSSTLQTLSAKALLQVVAGSWAAVGEDSLRKRDVVTSDDQIVVGSLCVGVDCVNGESFGFDTIRLKENNLRIKFEDTSTGSFPSTDWQLTANDAASGGKEKFSVEDITAGTVPVTVEGGAPTNSLYLDASGNVGLGGEPTLNLHVIEGNTPALRLEQDSSSGFTPQTWDIGGNEANFFIRDVTSGSKLPFRIRPGADSSAIDIQSDSTVQLAKGVKLGGSSGVAIEEKNGAYYFAANAATLQFNVNSPAVEGKNEWRIRFSVQGFTFEQFRTPTNVWVGVYIVCRDSTFLYNDCSDINNLPSVNLESHCV